MLGRGSRFQWEVICRVHNYDWQRTKNALFTFAAWWYADAGDAVWVFVCVRDLITRVLGEPACVGALGALRACMLVTYLQQTHALHCIAQHDKLACMPLALPHA